MKPNFIYLILTALFTLNGCTDSEALGCYDTLIVTFISKSGEQLKNYEGCVGRPEDYFGCFYCMTNEADETVKIDGDMRTSCDANGISSVRTSVRIYGLSTPTFLQTIEVTSLDKTQLYRGTFTVNFTEPSVLICHRGYATVTLSAAPPPPTPTHDASDAPTSDASDTSDTFD